MNWVLFSLYILAMKVISFLSIKCSYCIGESQNKKQGDMKRSVFFFSSIFHGQVQIKYHCGNYMWKPLMSLCRTVVLFSEYRSIIWASGKIWGCQPGSPLNSKPKHWPGKHTCSTDSHWRFNNVRRHQGSKEGPKKYSEWQRAIADPWFYLMSMVVQDLWGFGCCHGTPWSQIFCSLHRIHIHVGK